MKRGPNAQRQHDANVIHVTLMSALAFTGVMMVALIVGSLWAVA